MTAPDTDRVPTRHECLTALTQIVVDSLAVQATRSPRHAAEAAWFPGSRLTVDDLEDLFRAERGLPPLNRAGAA